MDIPSTYNIIVGIPLLNSLRSTVSTYNIEMQYFVNNGFVGWIVGDRNSKGDCCIGLLKGTIPHLEYEVWEPSKSNKKQDQKSAKVNVILISMLEDKDRKNPRAKPKGQL